MSHNRAEIFLNLKLALLAHTVNFMCRLFLYCAKITYVFATRFIVLMSQLRAEPTAKLYMQMLCFFLLLYRALIA
jgi:hypothetical protein